MTLGKTLLPLAGAVVLLSSGIADRAQAQQVPDVCTVGIARAALSSGREQALCDCTTLTRGFVSHVQSSPDFVDLLSGFQKACPGLATVLGDVPTASIGTRLPRGTGDSSSDGGETVADAGGSTGGSSSGGDRPGGGGGSTDGGSTGGGSTGGGSTGGGSTGGGSTGGGSTGGGDGPGDDGPGGGDRTKGNNGHGNDDDGHDSSNPGHGNGKSRDDSDQDGTPPGRNR